MHMCARAPSLPLSTTCPFDFWTVPTVWYILFWNCSDSVVYFILELYQQCGIFYFGTVPTVWYILFSFYHSNTAFTENLTIKKKAVKFRGFFWTIDGGMFAKSPFLQMLWFIWVCNKRSDWCLESTRPWNQGTYIQKNTK